MKPSLSMLLFISALFILNYNCSKSDPCPTDQMLIDRFKANESFFATLSQDPKNTELLSLLGIIDSRSFLEETSHLTLIVWRKDLVGPGGFSKGYYYSDIKPSPLVDSIDAIYESSPAEQCVVFRPIKGSWYLYYSSVN